MAKRKKEKKSNPDPTDASRCLAIRKQTKRGQYVNDDDMDFCATMRSQFPEWYSETESDVFNATVPFGSQVQI